MAFQQKGIDVSSWQGNIDWAKVKADGIGFAILRAASGTRQDQAFIKNIQGARAQGMPCGVYLYSVAQTPAQAVQEAEFLLNLIKPYSIVYPVVYDIEDIAQHSLTNDQRTALVEAFCNRVAQQGYRPAVYASQFWFTSRMILARLAPYDKWVAQWGAPKPTMPVPVQLWQYSNKGRVAGITGDVDLNFSYVDYTAQQPANPTPPAPPITPTPPVGSSLKAGTALRLANTPLYATAQIVQPANRVSGTYWVYDGIVLNGRLRLTNAASRVGKSPIGSNVSGYAAVTDLNALAGGAK